MIIHDKYFKDQNDGLIYIHIPKTAGTSIERGFNINDSMTTNFHNYVGWDHGHKIWMQHATLQQIRQWWGPVIKDYFSFTFIRNPFDRAVSDWLWFKSGRSGSTHDYSNTIFRDYLLCQNSFKSLNNVDIANRDPGTFRSDHILPQSRFIRDNISGENLHVDFIGRFENLQQDWIKLMNLLSVKYKTEFNIKLPHINKSRSKRWNNNHYSTYYDDETREIATELYKADLALFKYEFETVC